MSLTCINLIYLHVIVSCRHKSVNFNKAGSNSKDLESIRICSLCLPQVSYFSTCSCLSNRQKFPSFFRTIPSDAFQVRAMIQILKHFDWTWAGLLVSDDDYGLHAARSFQSDLSLSGEGCLAYLEVLPLGTDPAELRRIVDVMKKSTARVVIVFAHEGHMIKLMKEVMRQNVTGLQWMASEAWTAAPVLQTPQLMPYLGGTLGIAIRRGEIPGLRKFLLQIHPSLHNHSNSYGNSMVRSLPFFPPRSVCSESCPPDSMECIICPEDFWSSPQRDQCVPKKTEFLSYHDPLGLQARR
ncbi:extracellular calcium-sensing receptor-like [Acanthochromis polyacanthus]|uniref:extracellular calcium-sensing receptor-like n=1 Tax=Acanthochromis polyacanthus TaxID=80966 RepID=UPI0022348A4F|nr:extracellular calcium-sensing receptor-like [Acanthochromis polyacanthus]